MGYNTNVALALTFAAGAATWIGSVMVFLTTTLNTDLLATALGFAAGVMVFVSFVEIFSHKAVEHFISAGHSSEAAFNYAVITLIAGCIFTMLLDLLCDALAKMSVRRIVAVNNDNDDEVPTSSAKDDTDAEKGAVPPSPKNDEIEQGCSVKAVCRRNGGHMCCHVPPQAARSRHEKDPLEESKATTDDETLQKSGLLSGLSIAIHNFPEGMATFVATMADPKVGATLATAIAIHNLPEGLCVSLPVYYATGSRMKAFLWSFLCGLSEPLGGVFAYLVLDNSNASDHLYGSLFGVVGGIMIYISIKELLPTAFRYDPHDRYVSLAFVVGMDVMAGSMSLFSIDGGHSHGGGGHDHHGHGHSHGGGGHDHHGHGHHGHGHHGLAHHDHDHHGATGLLSGLFGNHTHHDDDDHVHHGATGLLSGLFGNHTHHDDDDHDHHGATGLLSGLFGNHTHHDDDDHH